MLPLLNLMCASLLRMSDTLLCRCFPRLSATAFWSYTLATSLMMSLPPSYSTAARHAPRFFCCGGFAAGT